MTRVIKICDAYVFNILMLNSLSFQYLLDLINQSLLHVLIGRKVVEQPSQSRRSGLEAGNEHGERVGNNLARSI